MHIRLTDTEIKKLLKENFMIMYDTREQVNQHVLDYFDKAKVKYKKQKIDEGDYTAIITKAPELGIHRDLYFKIGVERKNGLNELAGNLCEKTDSNDDIRLERELMRAKMKGVKIFLIVEDKDGLENIRAGKYQSEYKPQSFIGKLTSIQDKYLQGTIFTNKKDTGFHIYRILYYAVRNFLKEGDQDISPVKES
jgi:hypothetical protein